MNTTLKKLLSIILVFCMVVTIAPISGIFPQMSANAAGAGNELFRQFIRSEKYGMSVAELSYQSNPPATYEFAMTDYDADGKNELVIIGRAAGTQMCGIGIFDISDNKVVKITDQIAAKPSGFYKFADNSLPGIVIPSVSLFYNTFYSSDHCVYLSGSSGQKVFERRYESGAVYYTRITDNEMLYSLCADEQNRITENGSEMYNEHLMRLDTYTLTELENDGWTEFFDPEAYCKIELTGQDLDDFLFYVTLSASAFGNGKYDYNKASSTSGENAWQRNITEGVLGNFPAVNVEHYQKSCRYYDEFDYYGDVKDPLERYANHKKIDVRFADWILRNVFNCSRSDISIMKKNLKDNPHFYLRNGFYYAEIGGVGWAEYVSVVSDREVGNRHIVNFDLRSHIMSDFCESYYAVVCQKTYKNTPYWSLYYFGKEYPDMEKYRSVTAGDVNGNGEITAADARLALRCSTGLEKYKAGYPKFRACDIDRNKKISASDARHILRAVVGLEKPSDWKKY